MYKIRLQAVDSREATDEELAAAQIEPDQYPSTEPLKWQIMAHQAATVKALRVGDAPIIVNKALTGDGKSLAGQFPFYADQTPTLTMYPTNELAIDQKRGVEALLDKWRPPKWNGKRLYREVLNAAALDEVAAEIEGATRHDALNRLLNNELVLTNPDIFHLIMQFGYRRHGAARDLILTEVVRRFKLFVFDEFHSLDTPQTTAAMIAILLTLQIGGTRTPPRFLLLSATSADSPLQHLAGMVGLRIETIEGSYQHGLATTPEHWRRILQPITLHLDTGRLDEWIAAHFEDVIVAFFQRNRPGAKGVIICNSVATAYRVLAYLKTVCVPAGICIGINTGLTPHEHRNLDDVDLLVATSTVDVGVDFRINLLIFESMNASSHIQRLGRLGRHIKDSDGNNFHEFEAYGLLPQWVLDALGKEIPDGSEVDRECYYKTIQREDIYPRQQSFSAYIQQWAGVQASHVLTQLSKKEIGTQYQTYRDALQKQFRVLFPRGYPRYKELLDNEQAVILDEARSFRGSSPFTAIVQDMTDEKHSIVAYNLITLLMNAQLEKVELSELYAEVARRGGSINALERAQPLAGYRLHDWLPKPRPVEVFVDRELDARQFNSVIELQGVRLIAPDVQGMTALNNVLEEQTLVALLVKSYTPDTLRVMLRLGVQLELFRFRSRDGSEGCAVFGRDALLLDSILYRFRKSEDNRPLIF